MATGDLIGGFKKTELNEEQVKALLSEWWGVSDRATADENLDWLLTEGHRMVFQEDMANLEEIGLVDLSSEELQERGWRIRGTRKRKRRGLWPWWSCNRDKGGHAIDAWDYCRALQVLGVLLRGRILYGGGDPRCLFGGGKDTARDVWLLG
ncbi:MAG: DUF1266 domain-containing protein [Clostridia bacterium]